MTSYTIGTATTINAAWECPRCNTINAPNTSKCDCVAAPIANPSYPQYPWIDPQTWPPYVPYVGDPIPATQPYTYPQQTWITTTPTTSTTGDNIGMNE